MEGEIVVLKEDSSRSDVVRGFGGALIKIAKKQIQCWNKSSAEMKDGARNEGWSQK